MNNCIYLDYAADTPLDPNVVEIMSTHLRDPHCVGNAASLQHAYGRHAASLVETAAQQVAQLIAAEPQHIVWTSGATEANNLAIQGIANAYQSRGKHIITSATEHKAVLDVCAELATRGYTITYVKPNTNGVIAIDDIANAIRDDTVLVSIMHVNNETGVIQDIERIGKVTKQRNVLFHVDAAQSAARVPIDVKRMGIDLLSLSAHKLYGPDGIGALYIAPSIQLSPLFYGGGQQRRLRPGTLPVLPIIGMGAACQQVIEQRATDAMRISELTKRLWDGMHTIGDVELHGDLNQLAPGFLNVSFAHIAADALITGLTDIAVSAGSACMSTSTAPSYVLLAMGKRSQAVHNAIRFSLGRMTTVEDIDNAIVHIRAVVKRLRELSPLWEIAQTGVDVDNYPWQVTQ